MNSNAWHFRNHAGEFVAEDGGRHYHFGVITAFENLEVGAAGERGFDADADFARFERGRRDVLNLNFSPAVQDGSFHAGSLRVRTGERKKFPNQNGVLSCQFPETIGAMGSAARLRLSQNSPDPKVAENATPIFSI